MRRAIIASVFAGVIVVGSLVALPNLEAAEPETPVLTEGRPVLKARGAYLARAGNCMGCHTAQGGQPYAGGRNLSTAFGTFFTPNITPDHETGIGRWSSQDFWRALHEGKSRGDRPLYPAFPYTEYTKVTRDDSDAIFAYLQTLPPVSQRNLPNRISFPYSYRPLLYVWRALYFKSGIYQPQAGRSEEWNRGAYLVQGLGHCNACHATRNALGAAGGAALGGGYVEGLNWYAPSLTSRTETGIPDSPTDDIVRLLATGVSPRAFASGPMAEVVRLSLQHLTDEDLHAIATYLKSLSASGTSIVATGPVITDQVRKQFEQGAKIYKKHCEDCHGTSGQGAPRAYPPLAANRAVVLPSPLNAIRSVLNGGYPPSTAGIPRPYGMPPFAQTLKGEEIATVLSYVRNAWGNQGSLVTAIQVDRSRGK